MDGLTQAQRTLILATCRQHNVRSVRIFGSHPRGTAHAGSDIDLLVEPGSDFTLFDHGTLIAELEESLGCKVDVVTHGALHPVYKDQVLAEAVPV